MLKNSIGNLRKVKEEVVIMENQIKKIIYQNIAIHMEENYKEALHKVQFMTYNPFLANLSLRISFLYLKIYASTYLY